MGFSRDLTSLPCRATAPNPASCCYQGSIVARQFQAAGCQVCGVDPGPRMADLARQGGLEVEVARFEAWDPADRAFDVAVTGQAWHWVALG